MRLSRTLPLVLLAAVCVYGQGGRRGNAQQAGANPAANPAGRGATPAAATPAPATTVGDFFTFDPSAPGGQPILDAPLAESHQKITIEGQPLAYTTHAGYLPLLNATTGATQAHIFYTAYAKDGADAATRPILFFLGGAPGVAATWQEFGGLGPKRIAGAKWSDNPHTLLAQADLVFVNPVGTAFSRPAQPALGPGFWNTAADTASLGDFVRTYLRHNGRTTSPLFVAAEDFGTSRAANLATYLIDHQVPVHGVVLLSLTMSADSQAGDAQYITLLPSLVLTSWRHKKLSPELNGMSLEQIAGQARQFASRQYLHALYSGDRMTADDRTKVVAELQRLTGLSKAFIVSNNLRVTLDRYAAELLRDQHETLAYSDSRVAGFQPAPAFAGRGGGGGGGGFGGAGAPPLDFANLKLSEGFLAAYDAYLRNELAFTGNRDGVFYLSNGGVTGYTATGGDDASLAQAFARNPNLKLFVGLNFFDLSAPFYAAEFTLAHLSVSPDVRAHNITVSHYEAGQMPYTDDKALAKLHRDLTGWIAAK